MQLHALSTLLLIAMLPAQAVVVPAAFAGQDATGPLDPFPGTYLDARQQVLIGSSQLTSLQAGTTQVTAVAFRRDGSSTSALAAGRARLVVRVSSGARSPTDASSAFADNHGATSHTVFDGEVAFPASPRLNRRDEPNWSAAYSFTIPFQSPVTYQGGVLCIELEGRALQASRWPVDYHVDPVQGSVTRIGTACGSIVRVTSRTASASTWYLRPGATAIVDVIEEHGAWSMLMLNAQGLNPPLDLSALGAPGCSLHVMPLVSLPTLVTRRPGRGMLHPGIGRVQLPLPNLTNFAGAQIFAQWLNVSGGRLTTSDALVLGLGAVATTDAAVVSSARVDGMAFPPTGRLRIGAMPVVSLRVQ